MLNKLAIDETSILNTGNVNTNKQGFILNCKGHSEVIILGSPVGFAYSSFLIPTLIVAEISPKLMNPRE